MTWFILCFIAAAVAELGAAIKRFLRDERS